MRDNEYIGPISQAPTQEDHRPPTRKDKRRCQQCYRAKRGKWLVEIEFIDPSGTIHKHGYSPVLGR